MLADFNDALVALSADSALREAFLREPGGALRSFTLDDRERAALIGIGAAALERYARSLLAKRWAELERIVPLTLRVCPDLGARYRAWLARHPAPAGDSVLDPGELEGLRALTALRAELAADPAQAPYAGDLLALEVLRSSSRHDGRPRHLRSRYALPELVADLERGLVPIDPPEAPTEVRFDRRGARWRAAP